MLYATNDIPFSHVSYFEWYLGNTAFLCHIWCWAFTLLVWHQIMFYGNKQFVIYELWTGMVHRSDIVTLKNFDAINFYLNLAVDFKFSHLFGCLEDITFYC